MSDRPPATNPSVAADRIHEGDVLFFAPPVETDDLTDFAQLAARVQGAPWVHVAVAGPPGPDGLPEVVGFDQTGDPDRLGLNWTPEVVVAPWSSTAAHAVTALRPPTGGTVLAEAARRLVDAPYDIPGLLAFAAATQARMFAPGAARDRLLHFADGLVAQDRSDRRAAQDAREPHTCVSAVAAALVEAGQPVTVVEPTGDMTGDPDLFDLLGTSIDELYDRVERANPVVVRATGAIGRPALVPTEDLRQAWGYDDAMTQFPGPVIPSTEKYLELLDRVIAHRAAGKVTADQLVSRGELEPRRDAVHPTVSPAMLHAGLLAGGFTEVA